MKRIFSLIALTAAMFAAIAADAAALSETDAGIAASRWARRRRLGIKLSPQRTATRRYTTQDGNAFYGVRLGSSGTVFVADVGGKGSVLAFTRQPLAQIDEASPLYALISRDLAAREGMTAGATDITADDESDIDDLRVMPFVTTKWNQSEAYAAYNVNASVKCYDYYTPSPLLTLYLNGEIYRPETEYPTPCGCVATAMAQTMRYWQYPAGHSSFSNTITRPVSPSDVPCINYYGTIYYTSMEMTNELVSCEETAYDWSKMIECPLAYALDEKGNPVWSGDPVTEDQCKAIGGFTYDCGVSVGLEYSPSGTGLYTSQMAKIPAALTNVFGYASAVVRNSMKNGTLTADPGERARAILTNLDAKRPVILLISGNRGGHAVVADGYGFVGRKSTPFVHLNMGWAGQCDVWYNLPSINVSDNPENFSGFDTIDGVVYNIAPEVDMVGEIVSGCAVDEDGNPVEGVAVKAYRVDNGSFAGNATTDERGVYSLVLPPSATGYDIFATKESYVGDAYTGRVAESCDEEVGNSWGNDLSMGLPKVRVGDRLFSGFRHAVEFAQRKGEPLVEVLRPCSLAGDITVSTNLSIVATNAAPRQSTVVCSSYTAPFKVADGARLSLSNIVMSAADVAGIVNVDVASNGVVAVAGTVIVDSIVTAAADGFELAGPLKSGIEIKCLIAKEAGSVFGVASFADAADSAAYVFNGFDPELAGVAEGGVLKWAAGVPVPPAAAYAVFVGDSGTLGFRSFDQLISSTSGVGEMHLLRRCRFTAKALFANDCLLTSDNGDGLFVEGGGFTVTNSTLTISNIVISGSAPNPLFTLGIMVKRGTTKEYHKGNLVLADGACIADYANTVRQNSSGGAVSVQYGTARLLAGSVIDGCSVTAANSHGGGVYLRTGYAGLELAGGAISNCVAGSTGGGVYADGLSTIRVTAPSFVVGNSAVGSDGITTTDSDVYVNGGDIRRFVLAGDAAGSSIGVDRVDGSVGAPIAGDAFMSVEVDAQTATNSASAFFSNDADLTGAVSGDAKSLVWMDAPDPNQCEPDRAVAVVVYDEDGETNYYSTVLAALVGLRGDAAVFVATNYISDAVGEKDWYIYGDVEIQYNVRLCTADGAETPATIFRDFRANSLTSILGPCTLFVRPGATLTLSNIVFKGAWTVSAMSWAKYPLFAVDGGTLVMEDGTKIVDIEQWGSRASGAVNVYNDGVFRMLGGTIRNIVNSYESTEADYGVGAGVLVDGGTAYFEGGSVDNCTATRYAGVYVGNGGKAYVSGGFSATGSRTYATAERPAVDSNIAVQDLSTLVLTAPLTGTIGFNEGVKASTNIFGEVGCELTDEVVASATNFHHDVTGALGAVATNAEGRAVLVWSSAFPAGEDFFEEGGVAYYHVVPPPPPPVYTIHYVGGAGSTGTMEDTVCKYGKVYNLRKCTLSKSGSHFVGWAWNGRLYDDGLLIFNLSDVDGDELDFVAVWVAD